jgi:hypothetical protein
MKSIFSFIHSFFENKDKPVKLYNDKDNNNVVEEVKEEEVKEKEVNVITEEKEGEEEVSEETHANEFSGEELFEETKNQSMESIVTISDDLEKSLEIYEDEEKKENIIDYLEDNDNFIYNDRHYTDYLDEKEEDLSSDSE